MAIERLVWLLKRHYLGLCLDYEPLTTCQAFELHNHHSELNYSDRIPHT